MKQTHYKNDGGYYHEVEFRKGLELRANVFKGGEETKVPHFGCWQKITRKKPDFHQPDDFGTMIIE